GGANSTDRSRFPDAARGSRLIGRPSRQPRDRTRASGNWPASPGPTARSTQGCATLADNPVQSGPSLKLSRRSGGCQRIAAISRMGFESHVVQSSKFPSIDRGTKGPMRAHDPLRSSNSPRAASLVCAASLVGILAMGVFALGLSDDPFVDEYAYIT